MTDPATPRYAQRFARIPAVLARLEHFPDGLAISELAAMFAVDPDELREDILAFYTADTGPSQPAGYFRRAVVEFLGADGSEAFPDEATVVRVTDPRPAEELGVVYVDAAELALLFQAAADLLALEPDDEELAGAVRVLQDTMLPPDQHGDHDVDQSEPAPLADAGIPALVTRARTERRALRIRYSRAWEPGVSERIIEPYVMRHTRRGWEVDAGPLQPDGSVRTFLLSNVRSAELLEDTFDVPSAAAAAIEASRRATTAEVVLPQSARWAADRFAERVAVLEEDEEALHLQVELLPPLVQRLGLLLTIAGPSAFVVAPSSLVDAPQQVATQLLEHHQRDPRP